MPIARHREHPSLDESDVAVHCYAADYAGRVMNPRTADARLGRLATNALGSRLRFPIV